ncbi:CRTAC1 family protein [Lacinutrix jangbogonensis]|uniref:CRTAC1 family protein n=1 Tax=Lacinutrix jangbogonensis TaxID=1469557 RepID=UPI00068E56C0|nr:CRTAC1 family protein [Lacinutrix jangbogonensis]
MKTQSFYTTVFLLLIFFPKEILSQEKTAISEIISKIYDLEKEKDPKCYATANRLEDFIYGTPLNENARNLKIEVQKEIIYYLRKNGSEKAESDGLKFIQKKHIQPIIDNLSSYTKNDSGDYSFELKERSITVLKLDYKQYASVSYTYRSLLSVEQDLLFFSTNTLLPFNTDALELANHYVNLITLVTLQIADVKARENNVSFITKDIISNSWISVLSQFKNAENISKNEYPNASKNSNTNNVANNSIVKEIIKQKLKSYEKYNQLNTSVFLRNIQVYFAKQKWPTDKALSNALRQYYLESLIQFTTALIQFSEKKATNNSNTIIRVEHVQNALNAFLPASINMFEDVTFFPNSETNQITIESYDLDAFRDSGFHWNILDYALNDLQKKGVKNIGPNAAELLVEGIAQMGVLVLRLAGEYSHSEEKKHLDITDIEQGFIITQDYINTYDFSKKQVAETKIYSANTNRKSNTTFKNSNKKTGLEFTHKSSDWLSRHIRSYTVSNAEGVIKLAIPPAFGGSGVACEDINNDGLIDILLLGGFGNKLFLNSKSGKFKDVTQVSKINNWDASLNSYGEPRQPIIADFNNDGFQDIFITYVNMPHKMYSNTDGLHFNDVSTLTNLGGKNAVAGPATTFDYDNDGLLDIFIGYFGNYIEGKLPNLSRDNQNGMPNKLFKNLGDFKFVEVPFTQETSSNNGWTQALGHSDINQDGLQDLIIGNDFGVNKYYYNSKSGVFNEVSKQLKTDKPSYTMNVGITDLNGDLFPDFYISNIVVMQKDEKYVSPNENTTMKFDRDKMSRIRTIEANDLFISEVKNDSLKAFNLSSNIGRGYSATGWSWDADFFDFDNDGDEDLYCLNGMNDFSVYSIDNPFYFKDSEQSRTVTYAKSNREKNVFFVNNAGVLINEAETLGADLNSNARSASYLDYDNDGDLDIIINNYHDNATLLENETSNENRWIKIKLIGNPESKINRDAIGSSLILNSPNHKNIWREIHSTTGYLSVHPKMQHFGLGHDKKTDVRIKWSNGEVFNLENVETNTTYHITYPNILLKI